MGGSVIAQQWCIVKSGVEAWRLVELAQAQYEAVMSGVSYGPISWERMIRAVEKVRERLMRATAALEAAGIPYAVAGGNAVAAWVSRVDEAAVRNTRDVDILIRRDDLERVKTALAAASFVYRHAKSIDMFLDGPDAKVRDAIHIVFAGEQVRPECLACTPLVDEFEIHNGHRILTIDALLRMLLSRFNSEDGMLLRDLIDVGLVGDSWLDRLPSELALRLKEILDNPEG
jgi:hypothetical protein